MDKEKVLVVDDDPDWLETLDMILGAEYALTLTAEPSQAVSLLKLSFFPVAILDQRILADPLGGIHLFERLLKVQPDLRGIILTGYAEVDDAVHAIKFGAFDYLFKGKPNLAEELRNRVQKAIKDRLKSEYIAVLIEQGEHEGLEFKSSARWDMRLNKVNHDLEGTIVKTVAAFLNSELGGVLLIGVDDNGKIIGLENDYKTLRKQDRDGFANFLVQLLLDACGKDVNPLIQIDFHNCESRDVCRISAKPALKAVFVRDKAGGDHLYIRTKNSTRQMSTREAVEYCKLRWQ